jgi:hypothetical protein
MRQWSGPNLKLSPGCLDRVLNLISVFFYVCVSKTSGTEFQTRSRLFTHNLTVLLSIHSFNLFTKKNCHFEGNDCLIFLFHNNF